MTRAGNALRATWNDSVANEYEEFPRFPSTTGSTRMARSAKDKDKHKGESYKPVIKVFPNPAKDILNIAYETSSETDMVYIRITDLFGREMVNMKKSGGVKKQEINTSAWSSGTFIYEVRVNNERSGSGIFLISR